MMEGSLNELYKLFRRDRAPVAFVGSGLSTNYISWDEFALELSLFSDNTSSATWLEKEIRNSSPNHPLTEDVLAITRESKEHLDGNQLAGFMKNKFTVSDNVPSVFEALVRAPFAFYITTNYDNNIERAWNDCHGNSLPVLTFENCTEILLNIATGKKFIFKLHGCAEIGGKYIISDVDYKNIVHNKAEVRLTLSTVFAAHPVVFMGYGHRDPHISNHLLDHRAILERGGQKHFTFFIQSKPKTVYSIPAKLRNLYGIASVKIEDWSNIREIVSQLSYVRLGDRSVSVRLENYVNFDSFTKSGNVKSAWGAMLFAAASSEIGRSETIPRLINAVESSSYLEECIKNDDGLNAIYLLVSAQYLKRGGKQPLAEKKYLNLEILCRDSKTIIPTLKSKGIRYAGIYWLAHNRSKGLSLLDDAKVIAANADAEEYINAKKWVLVASRATDAPEKLLKLSDSASEEGFIKSAAWCKYGSAKLEYELNPKLSIKTQSELKAALVRFESIDHLQGIAECNLLLAMTDEKRDETQKSRLLLSSSIAKMCGLNSTERKANTLIANLTKI